MLKHIECVNNSRRFVSIKHLESTKEVGKGRAPWEVKRTVRRVQVDIACALVAVGRKSDVSVAEDCAHAVGRQFKNALAA